MRTAAPGGGFERGGWALPLFDSDSEGATFVNQVYQRAEAFLFGRRTYEIFAGSWGTWDDPGDSPIWTALNTRPKYVASTKLTDPLWADTTVVSGDVAAAIGELKAKPAGELQVHGSGALVRWLLDNHLVDEITLLTYPVVIGRGTRLFPDTGPDMALEVVESRATPKGNQLLAPGERLRRVREPMLRDHVHLAPPRRPSPLDRSSRSRSESLRALSARGLISSFRSACSASSFASSSRAACHPSRVPILCPATSSPPVSPASPTDPTIGPQVTSTRQRLQVAVTSPESRASRTALTSRASVGPGRCVLRAPGGPVDMDRYRAGGTSPPNLFLTLGRHRKLFRGWLRFAGRLMPGGKLPRRETELVILRVAHLRACRYEFDHHIHLARRAGIGPTEVERVMKGPEPMDGRHASGPC